jgi:hypothetical protein
MWYSLFARLGGFALIVALWYAILMSAGCEALTQMSDDWCEAHPAASQARCWGHAKEQSWDQENLKRNDRGCPTAIYTAPGGVLTQCD